MDGICTLANDRIYDQLVALLNSIEAILGSQFPVCVYPYDDHTEKIAALIAKRPNVQLYDNQDSIEKWDNFVKAVWDTHPTAQEIWRNAGSNGYHRLGTHRRFCAFDGPFDRFLYMDGDTLLIDSPDIVFSSLDDHDCVVYDFQHKDPTHVYTVTSEKLNEVFPSSRVESEIFCSGFYASKKDLFDEEKRDWLLSKLKEGEAEILYPMAPDQTMINYMMMRCDIIPFNLAFNLPKDKITGCCVTSPHFQVLDNLVYDGGKRLVYLHYIGLSSKLFGKVCNGENIDFPYRDLFLHYRYLHEKENRPQFKGKPKAYNQPPSLMKRVLKKLNLVN